MARYRKIEVSMWHDERFLALSRAQPNGQTLWIYLLCGPRTTLFPGLLVGRAEVMASDLGWTTKAFQEAFQEAFAKGLAKADWKAGVVVLRKALVDSLGDPRDTAKPQSPNVLKGWASAWDEIPDSPLKDEYLVTLRAFAEGLGKAYREAFAEGFRKALAKARAHPLPNQDQEQEQDTGTGTGTSPRVSRPEGPGRADASGQEVLALDADSADQGPGIAKNRPGFPQEARKARPAGNHPPEAKSAAEALLSAICKNLPNGILASSGAAAKTRTIDQWSNQMRLLHERDGRSYGDIMDMIAWCQEDSFWRANILSPGSLRKNWDKLALVRMRPGPAPAARSDSRFGRIDPARYTPEDYEGDLR